MKTRILALLEQRVEFIVLGIVIVVFAVYLAMQFVGQPNAETIDKGTLVPPGEVKTVLLQRIEKLQTDLSASKVDERPDHHDLVTDYRDRAGQSVVPDGFTAFAQGAQGTITGSRTVATEMAAVHVPSVPVPTKPLVYQSFDTLAETEVSGHEELSQQFTTAPYDTHWLTVSAVFNADELLARYASEGPEGETPMSDRWYDQRVDILDVVVERRQRLPDGSWGPSEILEQLPGQVTYRTELAEEEIGASKGNEIVDAIRVEPTQRLVVQPEYFETDHALWEDPEETSARLARGGEDDPCDAWLAALYRQRDIKAELKQLGAGDGDDPGSGPGSGPGGGMGGGMGGGLGGGMGGGLGGGGFGGGPPGGQPSPGGDAGNKGKDKEKLIRRLNLRLRTVEGLIKRLEQECPREVTLDDEGPAKNEDPTGFEVKGDFWVWAHDTTARAGEVYDYRISVQVFNPTFARRMSLPEHQRSLANKLTLASDYSQWSDPIRVDRPTRFFIRSATGARDDAKGGALGLGVARLDLYRFHDGLWHQASQIVQPGDPIGIMAELAMPQPETSGPSGSGSTQGTPEAAPITINYATGWYVMDIITDTLSTANALTNRPGGLVLIGDVTGGGMSQVRSAAEDASKPRPTAVEESSQEG